MESKPLITDGYRLVRVTNEFDREIRCYDYGYGPLFVHQDSMGVTSVIRAESWEDAYGIWEDEFAPEADEPRILDMATNCEYDGPIDQLCDNAIFQENYGFRPNGPNVKDTHNHGIYQKDLNGDRLDPLDQKMAEHLRLTVLAEKLDN